MSISWIEERRLSAGPVADEVVRPEALERLTRLARDDGGEHPVVRDEATRAVEIEAIGMFRVERGQETETELHDVSVSFDS